MSIVWSWDELDAVATVEGCRMVCSGLGHEASSGWLVRVWEGDDEHSWQWSTSVGGDEGLALAKTRAEAIAGALAGIDRAAAIGATDGERKAFEQGLAVGLRRAHEYQASETEARAALGEVQAAIDQRAYLRGVADTEESAAAEWREWADGLVPPVEGGPRPTDDEQRAKLEAWIDTLRDRVRKWRRRCVELAHALDLAGAPPEHFGSTADAVEPRNADRIAYRPTKR